MRRGVFAKETKDKVAVRKYAIVDTHKGDDRNYPPYVVYFTDYSPGRKEPLQTALRAASSADKAAQQVELWLADNIKRGWNEVESARVGEPIGAAPEPAKTSARKASGKKASGKKASGKKASAKKASAKKAPAEKASSKKARAEKAKAETDPSPRG